jgi:hypothetical protein
VDSQRRDGGEANREKSLEGKHGDLCVFSVSHALSLAVWLWLATKTQLGDDLAQKLDDGWKERRRGILKTGSLARKQDMQISFFFLPSWVQNNRAEAMEHDRQSLTHHSPGSMVFRELRVVSSPFGHISGIYATTDLR